MFQIGDVQKEREVAMLNIKEQLKKLPEKPGVYLMKDAAGEIIYVGKANSLKNRVRQYFQHSNHRHPKVKAMVSNIAEFEYIITDSEIEALILESNLIKKHRPKYNILLRDDKQYPYIKVTLGEKFPRIIKTRKVKRDQGRYFGPYIDVGAVNQTLDILRRIYPLRTCSKNLNAQKKVDRPCLNYHIHQCLGVCSGDISHEEYMKMIDEVILFLSGKYQEIVKKIELKMKQAAEQMNYEKAAEYRDQIHAIESIMEKQKIVLQTDTDRDFIAMAKGMQDGCVVVFFVRGGKLMGTENYMLSIDENDTIEEMLSSFVKQFYAGTAFIPKQILLEAEIDDRDIIEKWLSSKKGSKVTIQVPKRGEKKELLQLVHKNAVEILERFREKLIREREKSEGAVQALGELLGLREIPYRIEAYDVSNIQGAHSVAAMVVFEKGKPKYSDYRRFRIQTIEGPNDYASMQEVIYRRFKEEKKEKTSEQEKIQKKFEKLPDLILVDGGSGQVHAVLDVLHALRLDIPVAGMVKDKKHRTRDLFYNEKEWNIRQDMRIFQLIASIQEEAHRFAISYHRSLRGKTIDQSILDEIPGIGPKRKAALLKHFGTIEKIKNASIKDLSHVDGIHQKLAEQVHRFFLEKNKKESR